MEAKSFAPRDEKWGARYLLTLAWQDGIDRQSVVARQNELVDSIEAAGISAEELFGDADALARADVAELAWADAEATEDPGARDILRDSGGILVFLGAILGGKILLDGGGLVDVQAGPLVLGLAIVVAIVAGSLAVAVFGTGRGQAAKWLAAGTLVAIVGGAVATELIGAGPLVEGIPRWSVAAAGLVPGLVVLAGSRLVRARPPQVEWADDQWFERFRTTLRARGVPAAVVAEHERTLRADLTTTTAVEEYGSPVALAQRLAADDPQAPRRRQWRWSALWLALALVNVMVAIESRGLSLIAPIALSVGLLAAAGVTAVRAWRSRTPRAA